MSGQIDVGWAAPPFGLREIQEGKIRIIARGSDVPSLRGQTVRVLIANANMLAQRKEAVARFMAGYRESVDWMYANPEAVAMFSKKTGVAEDLVRRSMQEFQPKDSLQTDHLADLDGAVRDAVKLKFLDAPLTKEQLAELIQIPPRQK
jgi:NitT/TauT family transport system substrate-binding protein